MNSHESNSRTNFLQFRLTTVLWIVITISAFFAGRIFHSEQIESNPPPGKAGLDLLIRNKKIRLATRKDVDDWYLAASKPSSSVKTKLEFDLQLGKAYFVEQHITLPDKLHGAHQVSFIIPKDVPFPAGPRGHNQFFVLDGSMYGIWE